MVSTTGTRIRQLRNSHNLTSEQLGKIAGVSKAAVSQWESDKTEPNAKALSMIARHFKVSADYLLFGENPPVEEIKTEDSHASALASKIAALTADKKLTDEELSVLNGMIDSLVKAKESKDDVANGTSPANKTA